MLGVSTDEQYMREALKQAAYAAQEGEIPVGAVVVSRGRIIARAYNQTERLQDVTAHAEMLAITAAANCLGAKYLQDCTLYVTLEPCPMCAGALYWSQLSRLVWGAPDEKRGFARMGTPMLHPKTELKEGVLAAESVALLNEFFLKLRKNGR
ncbi:nucleoside deaminase [Cesiribacter andamanensis]|uniref:tRNA-specific adenosine deaminase n=1 Tax=Cesiribacter andamanensis AMV16 TaxID=1279009 RepID=M7N6H7_9BACT|nr:nucleoside deaminase [Cesiribacter andamanensis]EMR02821.1 tRNA-specific adenosine deaminase [Cesiribacter andamanensis AMV16]